MPLPPIIFPAKRRVHRKRRTQFGAPPSGLTIVSVVNMQTFTLKVTFSAAITWDGVTVPDAFRAYTHDGFMDGAIYVDSFGADWLELEFNADVDPGAAWEVLAAMDGITPAVGFPQSGTVA